MAEGADFLIEKLSEDHGLNSFDCGNECLSIRLRRFAWKRVGYELGRLAIDLAQPVRAVQQAAWARSCGNVEAATLERAD